tara:strand:+ start:955 stop:2553 length:1599 start_codon:yes stop_codon:yes gene_type:complete
MITGKNYIGDKLSSDSSVSFKTFNPLLNVENNILFFEASDNEIEKSTKLANDAFKKFKQVPTSERSIFLNQISDELKLISDDIVKIYCSETGLSEARCLAELTRTINQLKSFAKLLSEGSFQEVSIDTSIPDRKPVQKPDLRRMLMPIGPVVVFGASNFPLAYSTAGGDTASALAAGCPVILKSHPMHAGTGELVAAAIIRAAKKTNMPNGVFSNLNSKGIEVGVKLVCNSYVKAVGFTGSLKGGRAIYDLASKRENPIPVFAEMGSVNPVLIFPNKLKKEYAELAEKYAKSITIGSGQFCTNPGIIVSFESENFNLFIDKLVEEIENISPSCMLHPNIHKSYNEGLENIKKNKNVAFLTKKDLKLNDNFPKHVISTVTAKKFIEDKNLQHEVFGPSSLLVRCEDKDEMLDVIESMDGQLTGTILAYENDEFLTQEIINALELKVGRIIFNGVPTGVEVCPSMTHGGPYPASTDSRFSAVGTNSIKRWLRPVSFQDFPQNFLPDELKNSNPLSIERSINGITTRNDDSDFKI